MRRAVAPAAFGPGQFPDKGQVLRTVPFVAIQVSEGGVIGERDEKVCSQLKRAIGEFCGLVGDSMAIATGSEVAVLKPVTGATEEIKVILVT